MKTKRLHMRLIRNASPLLIREGFSFAGQRPSFLIAINFTTHHLPLFLIRNNFPGT